MRSRPMRNLNDVESQWRPTETSYQGAISAHGKNAFEHQLAANRAQRAANNTEPGTGSSRLYGGGYGTQGAADNLYEGAARADNMRANAQTQRDIWASGREVQHERNLQNAAMELRDKEVELKYDAQNQMSNAIGSGLQGMNSGNILAGLTQHSSQPAGVDIFNSQGSRVGGSGYRSPLSGLS
jgi:hypothetical protein